MDSNSEMPPTGSGGLGIRRIPVHTLTPPISPHENSKQARMERRAARAARASRSRVPAASRSTAMAATAVAEPAAPKLISAPKADPRMASQCLRVLENFAAGKDGWDIFYPNGYTEFMDKAAKVTQELHSKGCTLEIAQRFSTLLLYDLVVLLGLLTFLCSGCGEG